jgi:hypothetical protein
MCSYYQALKEQDKYRRYFGVEPPADPALVARHFRQLCGL